MASPPNKTGFPGQPTSASSLLKISVWVLLAARSTHAGAPGGGAYRPQLAPGLEDRINRTEALPPDYSPKDGEAFDYIVVGAGAGGSAVAARLALAGHGVLLVEAGGDPTLLSKIPAAAQGLFGSSIDWNYKSIPNNFSCLGSEGQNCRFARGKCLGGSTAINYMMYVRGHPTDYDLDIPGWTWNDLQPYFLCYEGCQDLDLLPPSSIPYHNTSGTFPTGFFDDPDNPWHWRLKEGYLSLNLQYNVDLNAESQIGVSQVLGYTYNGERVSAADAYLTRQEIIGRLKVSKETKCTGVIINKNNVALGVTVVRGLLKIPLRLYARYEVVLSAGTLGTPQILLLSGIGPSDHLKSLNIPVRVDLPVGENLNDHVLALIFVLVDRELLNTLLDLVEVGTQATQWILSRDGPFASIGLTDVTVLANTRCYDISERQFVNNRTECDIPSLQMIHSFLDRGLIPLARPIFQTAIGLNDEIVDQMAEANSESAFIIFNPAVLHPYSRGWVRLASTDPLDDPAIQGNYLKDERDVDELLRSITILEHLMDTPTFKKQKASILRIKLKECPSYEADREGYWRCYSRHLTHSVFHSAGTCALGAVVDERLRVRGVRRLRVIDLSVLPLVPRGNTAAATLAIGERGAHFILEDNDCTVHNWITLS